MRFVSPDPWLRKVPPLWRALLAVIILCGALLALVESRASLLRGGAEVRLKTAPVDPRDLFRGDYVVLSYEISQVEAPAGAGFRRGEAVFVTLAPGPDGFAQAIGVSRTKPALSGNEIVLAGKVLSSGACAPGANGRPDCSQGRQRLRIGYGLESYFVPQFSGRAIERAARDRVEVVAAVSPDGQAAIKRLLIDGKLVHAEPPY